jgi:photoactive yellow protein
LGRLSQAELDSLPFGVMSVDLQGNILAVNRPEQEFAQKALNHSLGKNFFTEIAPCSQVRGFKGRFEAFVRSERAVHGFRFVYRFPKGNIGVVIEFVRASNGIIVIARRTV